MASQMSTRYNLMTIHVLHHNILPSVPPSDNNVINRSNQAGSPSISSWDVGVSRKPFSTAYSALMMLLVAAPMATLFDIMTNLMSRTGHMRILPTCTPAPYWKSLSKRGCGRSWSSCTVMHCAGAEGHPSACTSQVYAPSTSATRAGVGGGRRVKCTDTHSVWPSSTGTLLHAAEMTMGLW